MNLQKAIETKIIYRNYHSQSMTPDERSADNLSIEALKRCKELSNPTNYSPMRPLPGQTED